jgi:hypothetical protein
MPKSNMPKRSDYAPYDTMPAFDFGIKCYNDGTHLTVTHLKGVDEQAFDRGCEYAMRLQQAKRKD